MYRVGKGDAGDLESKLLALALELTAGDCEFLGKLDGEIGDGFADGGRVVTSNPNAPAKTMARKAQILDSSGRRPGVDLDEVPVE